MVSVPRQETAPDEQQQPREPLGTTPNYRKEATKQTDDGPQIRHPTLFNVQSRQDWTCASGRRRTAPPPTSTSTWGRGQRWRTRSHTKSRKLPYKVYERAILRSTGCGSPDLAFHQALQPPSRSYLLCHSVEGLRPLDTRMLYI